MNSSYRTGIAANCELVFLASPLFEHLRLSSVKLGNFNNMQGFIFTTRDIAPGEELRWKYSIDQAHRSAAQPPSPIGIVTTPNPTKRSGSQTDSFKRAKVDAAKVDATAVRVLHSCTHHTTCNPGKCSDCKCSECVANQVKKGVPRERKGKPHFE